MITLGAGSFLFIIIAVLISFGLSFMLIKLIDTIFWYKTIRLIIIELFLFAGIQSFTIYQSFIFMDDTVIKKSHFETAAEATLFEISPESITYIDNKTGEMTTVNYQTNDKLKPKLDKDLKSGEVKISTYASDWGSYKEITYNMSQK